jgi:hypothetical protein
MTVSPAWALGYDLAFLKQVASIFARDFKPHTYGAFGLPKERDIANALKDESLVWLKSDSGTIAAAAIFKIAKSTSKQSDFAQRTITIKPGDLQIKSVAGDPHSLLTLLQRLLAKAGTRPAWLELHAENKLACKVANDLSFLLAATKVSASSDIKSLYLLNDSPLERLSRIALNQADYPALKLLGIGATPDQIQSCLTEINSYNPSWEQHYSSYNKRQSWTAIALQGFDPADPQFIIKPGEMSKAWKQENPHRLTSTCAPTPAAKALPTVWELAQSIPGKLERVRLMRLRASNGELTRHADITDRDAGTANGRIARFHIPLQTAPGCLFSGWELSGNQVQLHFPAGSLFYLDIRKPHAVKNTSQVNRIHLVVDVACNAQTRELLNA